MKARTVLHVIRPAEGGMKGHLISLATGLMQKGYKVEAACPGDSPVAAELAGCGVIVYPVNLVGPLSPGNDFTCVNQLRHIINRKNYDIVHFHGAKAGLVGRVAALWAGQRNTVLTVHNFIIYREVPLAKRLLFNYGERLLSHATARIITVSKALKQDLVENYRLSPDKIIPVYNGIEITKYLQLPDRARALSALNLTGTAPIVGTVARMAPQKGLQYLIEAVPLIDKLWGGTPPIYVIAGDGPHRAELEAQADRLGVRERIVFPGYIDDIAGFFACLDVFVIPSIAEGLSITTIEAMAAGLPVVASRVGGLPELVDDGQTGCLVEPRAAGALAEAVAGLLGDREKAARFGAKGREKALGLFTIDKMVAETCRVYDTLLDNR